MENRSPLKSSYRRMRYHQTSEKAQMSKAAARKGKTSKKSSAKSSRISLSSRRTRSRGEDRFDGEAALKALRESAERIPYEKARRDLGL
jgi:hypothetical protein